MKESESISFQTLLDQYDFPLTLSERELLLEYFALYEDIIDSLIDSVEMFQKDYMVLLNFI